MTYKILTSVNHSKDAVKFSHEQVYSFVSQALTTSGNSVRRKPNTNISFLNIIFGKSEIMQTKFFIQLSIVV